MDTQSLRILRLKQVRERTGLSTTGIYSRLRGDPKSPAIYDPTFPRPVKLGPRTVGWLEHEIEAWIAEQVRKSRGE